MPGSAISPDLVCARIGQGQMGVIRLDQILAAGLTPQQITRRCQSRGWRRILPKVYGLPGAPDSWPVRVHATHHWAGEATAFSGATACVLHGIESLKTHGRVEIIAARCLPSKAGWLVVHRVDSIDPRDVIEKGGMALTTPPRALMDLAATHSRRTVQRALSHLLHERLTSVPLLLEELERHGRRGRKGTALMRELVTQLAGEEGRAENGFEARLFALLRRAGFPAPEQQLEIRHRGRFVARPDFAYPDLKIVIEADSYRWHSDPQDWRRDQVRHNALSALGWTILRFTWRDFDDPSEFFGNLRRAYRRLSA